MPFCCKELADKVEDHDPFIAGGGLYPPSMAPEGQIEQDQKGRWNVNGCCGGGCYVLHEIKFCPFCGASLPGTEHTNGESDSG